MFEIWDYTTASLIFVPGRIRSSFVSQETVEQELPWDVTDGGEGRILPCRCLNLSTKVRRERSRGVLRRLMLLLLLLLPENNDGEDVSRQTDDGPYHQGLQTEEERGGKIEKKMAQDN